MTDDTRQALVMITDLVDEMSRPFEGAFAAIDRHRPLDDQVAVLDAEFRKLTVDDRAHRFLVVMAMLEGDQEMQEAARHDHSEAVLAWRRLLALPAKYRDEVLEEWAEMVLDDEG
jgi:hypothetical protein